MRPDERVEPDVREAVDDHRGRRRHRVERPATERNRSVQELVGDHTLLAIEDRLARQQYPFVDRLVAHTLVIGFPRTKLIRRLTETRRGRLNSRRPAAPRATAEPRRGGAREDGSRGSGEAEREQRRRQQREQHHRAQQRRGHLDQQAGDAAEQHARAGHVRPLLRGEQADGDPGQHRREDEPAAVPRGQRPARGQQLDQHDAEQRQRLVVQLPAEQHRGALAAAELHRRPPDEIEPTEHRAGDGGGQPPRKGGLDAARDTGEAPDEPAQRRADSHGGDAEPERGEVVADADGVGRNPAVAVVVVLHQQERHPRGHAGDDDRRQRQRRPRASPAGRGSAPGSRSGSASRRTRPAAPRRWPGRARGRPRRSLRAPPPTRRGRRRARRAEPRAPRTLPRAGSPRRRAGSSRGRRASAGANHQRP